MTCFIVLEEPFFDEAKEEQIMAQSLTVQASNPYLRGDMEPFHVILDWQGDADMAVSKAIAATYAQARAAASLKAPFPERIRGRIVKIETIPGDAGTRRPTRPRERTTSPFWTRMPTTCWMEMGRRGPCPQLRLSPSQPPCPWIPT
jgi:hypothetical protein